MTNQIEIKSRDRVRDAGEVFTPQHIVEDMIKLIPDESWADTSAPVIEPTCGNGNFIVGIIDKLLSLNLTITQALTKTFGMDIMVDNIQDVYMRVYRNYLMRLPDDERINCQAILLNNIVVVKDSLQFNPIEMFTFFHELKATAKNKRIRLAKANDKMIQSGKQIEVLDESVFVSYKKYKGEISNVQSFESIQESLPL